jgi:hypothetical protein
VLREAVPGHAVACHLFDGLPALDGAAQSALLRDAARPRAETTQGATP